MQRLDLPWGVPRRPARVRVPAGRTLSYPFLGLAPSFLGAAPAHPAPKPAAGR